MLSTLAEDDEVVFTDCGYAIKFTFRRPTIRCHFNHRLEEVVSEILYPTFDVGLGFETVTWALSFSSPAVSFVLGKSKTIGVFTFILQQKQYYTHQSRNSS